jgi:hypothetical protein
MYKTIFLLCFFTVCVLAQEGTDAKSELTSQKERIVVFPSYEKEQYKEISEEIVGIVTNELSRLGRFEVIDRSNLQAALDEIYLGQTGLIDDSTAVKAGEFLSANTGILIKILDFSQQGVAPEESKKKKKKKKDDESIGEKIAEAIVKSIDKHEDNIRTGLTVFVKKIDIESAKTIDSFELTLEHTGGYSSESKSSVLTKFKLSLPEYLKEFYVLQSKIIAKKGKKIYLAFGKNIGIKEGMRFNVMKSGEKVEYGNELMELPEEKVGFIKITSVTDKTAEGIILRGFSDVDKGLIVREQIGLNLGISVYGGLLQNYNYGFGGLGIELDPYNTFSLGLLGSIGSATDNFKEGNFTANVSLYSNFKILRSDLIDVSLKVGLASVIASRNDDSGNNVNGFTLQFLGGANLDFYFGDNVVFFGEASYYAGGKISKWWRTDEPDKKVSWIHHSNKAPEINVNGLTFRSGIKFIFAQKIANVIKLITLIHKNI